MIISGLATRPLEPNLTPRGQRPGAGPRAASGLSAKATGEVLKVSPETVLRVVISAAGMPRKAALRHVPKLTAKLPRRFFPAFAEDAAVDHHVVLVSDGRSDPLAKADWGMVPA